MRSGDNKEVVDVYPKRQKQYIHKYEVWEIS